MELSVDEAERLSTLLSYDLLDTESEEVFDRLTNLAAHIFNVPVAVITLIDKDRQWFKSAFGMTIKQTPREHSFCAHAIYDSKVMTVPDATLDPRFAENPMVTCDKGIRFYSGAPLVANNNFGLGTICIVDHAPRQTLTRAQEAMLSDLAFLVMHELENRKELRALRRQK